MICIAMQRQGKQRSSSGPALPSKLSKEIGANNSEAGPRNERVSKAFALADRKAQRKAKRQKKGQQRLRFTQKLPQDSSSPRPLGKASRKRQPETRQEVCSRQLIRLAADQASGFSFCCRQVSLMSNVPRQMCTLLQKTSLM